MKRWLFLLLAFSSVCSFATSLLIPMDHQQKNHLKAYGLAYWAMKKDNSVDWLLNYRGGSFLFKYSTATETECTVRGISYEVITDSRANAILNEIASPAVNMNVVQMGKVPRIAVYSPKNAFINDDTDAVILVLNYAEIPYTIIYDKEILEETLTGYDWLHLHHEDFTGQHGRFMRRESAVMESKVQETLAAQLGFSKVSEMKLAVAKRIKAFCAGGGYLFAMCSGAETFDIALAADGVDISESEFDGDGPDPIAQSKLDFSKTLAFENFTLEPGYSRKFSNINTGRMNFSEQPLGYFTLFDFSAKWDIIPSLLNQNHEHIIREFMGQTTAFNKYLIKIQPTLLGENSNGENVRYLYGELGLGHWTFYGGHDPEGVPGRWREATDLNLHPHSPGYRLILNNVLFPSAKKKKQKT
ncbi:MAG: asparagine synthetase B [Azospira oryzae]|jgi:hypothetical protein|nr:MAG: asparagine synthetase B [Azospira oryzae]